MSCFRVTWDREVGNEWRRKGNWAWCSGTGRDRQETGRGAWEKKRRRAGGARRLRGKLCRRERKRKRKPGGEDEGQWWVKKVEGEGLSVGPIGVMKRSSRRGKVKTTLRGQTNLSTSSIIPGIQYQKRLQPGCLWPRTRVCS